MADCPAGMSFTNYKRLNSPSLNSLLRTHEVCYFLSNQSEEITRTFYLLCQTYNENKWLSSLKQLSALLNQLNRDRTPCPECGRDRASENLHKNSCKYYRNLHRPNQSWDNGISSCDFQEIDYHCKTNCLIYAENVKQFISIISSLVTDIISNIQYQECLYDCSSTDFVTLLEPVVQAYHSNTNVILCLIQFYFSLDLQEQALEIACKIRDSCPESILIQETFENICCHVFDRWHFKMLNDISRNRAFEVAISDTVSSGGEDDSKTVFDIGSGTGLLSFLSAKYVDYVYAIEKSTLMCHITQAVMHSKDFSEDMREKIHVINEMSSDLKVPENLTRKADVLVTETFDAGLFGEGIISTLSHAWKELLDPKHLNEKSQAQVARVVPQKAKLYVEAVSSRDIKLENSFHHNGRWHDLSFGQLSIVSCVSMIQSDPYTSCHIKDLPHSYKSLSDAQCFMEVNFNDPEEIFRLEKGVADNFYLEIREKGSLDALVVWFKLLLTDSVHLITSPTSEGCWEQAVFPVRAFDLNSNGPQTNTSNQLSVHNGDKLSVRYHLEEDRLSLHIVSIKSTDNTTTAATENFPDSSSTSQLAKLMPHQSSWWCRDIFCLNHWEIYTINQAKFFESLLSLAQAWLSSHGASSTCVVDTHHGFSPLALQMLHQGCCDIFMMTQQDSQKALACKLAQLNNLDVRKINFLEEVSEIMDFESLTCTETSSESKAVLTVCEIVDYQGRLTENLESNFEYLRFALSSVASKEVLPQQVEIYGVFVDCDKLIQESSVTSDDNTLGFPIGRYLNKYSVANYPDFTLRAFPHQKLTSEFKILTLDLAAYLDTENKDTSQSEGENQDLDRPDRNANISTPEVTNTSTSGHPDADHSSDSGQTVNQEKYGSVKDNDDGNCFDQTVDFKVSITKEGKLSALVYWFKLQLSPWQHIYTNDPSCHWKQAAVITDNRKVDKGSELSVSVRLKNSNIRVTIDD